MGQTHLRPIPERNLLGPLGKAMPNSRFGAPPEGFANRLLHKSNDFAAERDCQCKQTVNSELQSADNSCPEGAAGTS